jgi:RNA polymerase sigma factor (sigma-70 family)
MNDDGTGDLVDRWRRGDQQAAAELFQRYASRLIGLARSRLSTQMARRVAPEDLVQSVYRCFFANTRAGRYEIERGGDLWQLLVRMALHKLGDHVRRNNRAKRSVKQEQSFGSEDSLFGLQPGALACDPSPVEALALSEELERLMKDLEPSDRRMLELRLQGCNVEEIASAVACSQRTVLRVLKRIRTQLEEGLAEGPR